MSATKTLSVQIMDKEYLVACPPDAQEALKGAARQLDAKMREIRSSGKVYGTERIAVMAALNLTYEVMQHSTLSDQVSSSLAAISDRIDQELGRTV